MKKKISIFMSAAMLVTSVAPAVANAETSIKKDGVEYMKRFSSSDRFKTAVDVSKSNFSKDTSNLIIVNGMNPADALSGGPLAAKLNAPILLTNTDTISQDTLDEVGRLNPNKVYILGGNNSVSESVEKVIKSKIKSGATVMRISGANRYETSVKVAKELVGNNSSAGAGFVNGATNKFPDALSASALLGKKAMPLILTDGKNLPGGAESYKNNSKNYIIGGKSSIDISGLSGKRLSGSERYATSAAVANEGFKASDSSSIENACVIVDGRNYPDALTSISISKKNNAPILLVDKNLPAAISSYLKDQERNKGYIVGGINSVTIGTQNAILKILEDNYGKNGENAKLRNAKNKLRDRIDKLDAMVNMLEKNSTNSEAISSYKDMRNDLYNKYVKKELSELGGVTDKDLDKKTDEIQEKFDNITKFEDTQYYQILAKEIVDGRKRLEDKVNGKSVSDYTSNQKKYYDMLREADELQTKSGKNKERLEMAYELKNYSISSSSSSSSGSWSGNIKTAEDRLAEVNKDLTESPIMLNVKEELRFALEEAKKSQTSSNMETLSDKLDNFNSVYEDYDVLKKKISSAESLISDNSSIIDHRFSSKMLKDLTLEQNKKDMEENIKRAKDVLKSFQTKPILRNEADSLANEMDEFRGKVQAFKRIKQDLDETVRKTENADFKEEKLKKIAEQSKVKEYKEALSAVESIKNDTSAIVSENQIKTLNDNLKDSFKEVETEYDKVK